MPRIQKRIESASERVRDLLDNDVGHGNGEVVIYFNKTDLPVFPLTIVYKKGDPKAAKSEHNNSHFTHEADSNISN